LPENCPLAKLGIAELGSVDRGDELIALIERYAPGRRCLRVLRIPLLPYTAGSEPGRIDPLWPTWEGTLVVRWRDFPLDRYDEEEEVQPTSDFQWTRYEREKWTRVNYREIQAAYDADIRGALLERHVERGLRRDHHNGRKLLAALGAWPWACYGRDGTLPRRNWTRHELAIIGWRHWLEASAADYS
jgi:hypothetical protein